MSRQCIMSCLFPEMKWKLAEMNIAGCFFLSFFFILLHSLCHLKFFSDKKTKEKTYIGPLKCFQKGYAPIERLVHFPNISMEMLTLNLSGSADTNPLFVLGPFSGSLLYMYVRNM